MSLDRPHGAARIAIVLVAVALVACLVGPMMDDLDASARLAILCCVALIASAIFLLGDSGALALNAPVPRAGSSPASIPRRARPPDRISLGVLLS